MQLGYCKLSVHQQMFGHPGPYISFAPVQTSLFPVPDFSSGSRLASSRHGCCQTATGWRAVALELGSVCIPDGHIGQSRLGSGSEPRHDAQVGTTTVCSGTVGQLAYVQADRALYDDFIEVAIEKVQQHAKITPCPFQEDFREMQAVDGTTQIRNFAFDSEKIRLFRIAAIDGGHPMQVLNVAIFPRPEYDLPIFCADFFSTSTRNIIVLDLNPLYDTDRNQLYKQKYFSKLMPLATKYTELLPWGDKLTSESIRFFSPIVIWTKPERREDVTGHVFDAFCEYLEAYMTLMGAATASTDEEEVINNKEAQHRYLLWRATKDPGRPVLTRLYGEHMCESYVRNFLFNGLDSLGTKRFLDYFPEYEDGNGGISRQRSMIGKSFATRPWDKNGNIRLQSG